MKKILFSILTFSFLALPVLADDATLTTNPVMTAMPSLTIAPDGRSAGMGDVGVATTADLNSQHWNPAKYAFMESKGGLSVNYTPWLRQLVGDIDIAYIVGYYNMGEKAGALSGSLRYFSMGEVDLVNNFTETYGKARPNEWALDLAYSRKLHEYVSMAVAMRFLYSDLNNGATDETNSNQLIPAWTMAADLSLYYRQPISLPMGESYFGLGFNLSNLGGKMTYSESGEQNFIPANLRLGVSYELPFDNYNRLTATVECNKMLVPTQKSKFAEDQVTNQMDYKDEFSPITSVNGWWMSFCDAPNGAAEEFQEVQWGVGLEYSYNNQFFGRLGYSHENFWKGNRRYLTVGAGFHLSIFSLDFAYCIATAASNPLNGTMRFTLGFDLAGIKDMVNNRK